jgi:hypothetical protein
MDSNEAREHLIIGRATDQKVLESVIKTMWNCQYAEVNSDGNIWIEEPMPGHWLNDDHLIETVEWLKAR